MKKKLITHTQKIFSRKKEEKPRRRHEPKRRESKESKGFPFFSLSLPLGSPTLFTYPLSQMALSSRALAASMRGGMVRF